MFQKSHHDKQYFALCRAGKTLPTNNPIPAYTQKFGQHKDFHKLIYLHLFTKQFHEVLSSIGRRNVDNIHVTCHIQLTHSGSK